jgi:hypothetical protein
VLSFIIIFPLFLLNDELILLDLLFQVRCTPKKIIEDIVNPYVEYRLRYYRSRKDAKMNKGWFKRAKSFYMKESEREEEDNIVEDYIVLPKKQQYNIVEDIK